MKNKLVSNIVLAITTIAFLWSSFMLVTKQLNDYRPVYFLGLIVLALLYWRSRSK